MIAVYVLQHIHCETPGIISDCLKVEDHLLNLQSIGRNVFNRWVQLKLIKPV